MQASHDSIVPEFHKQKPKAHNYLGFTLVELIVVITILVILGTIAFISLGGYANSARDSSRVSDMDNIKKAFELTYIKTGHYPAPTGGTGVTFSGGVVWTQGSIGDSVINVIGAAGFKLSKVPTDPKYSTIEYAYSLLNTGKEYQIGLATEGSIAQASFVTPAYAADDTLIAYIGGNYNGVVAEVRVGVTTYYLSLPSIMLKSLSNTELSVPASQSGNLVVHLKGNLPHTYTEGGITSATPSVAFDALIHSDQLTNGSGIVAYSTTGALNPSGMTALVNNLYGIYSSSNLSSSADSAPQVTALVSGGTGALIGGTESAILASRYGVVAETAMVVPPVLGGGGGGSGGTGTLTMVKDINPSGSSSLQYIISLGSILLLGSSDGINGRELWKSDGTDAGTVMVKDINTIPGENSNPSQFVVMGGIAYFRADDGINGPELWKSDGTPGGTMMVKDINTVYGGSFPENLTVIGSTLYFSADDGINGGELWKSDGTEAGTVMMADIIPGVQGSSPKELIVMGSSLYFAALDGGGLYSIYKTNSAGTGAEIIPGSGYSDIYFVDTMGGWVYFGTDSSGIWRTNGGVTEQIYIGMVYGEYSATLNGWLYFRGEDATNGGQLWKSNGISGGTTEMVKDINPGSNANPQYLTTIGGMVYFNAFDGTHGQEFWKTDGTAGGTMMIADINLISYGNDGDGNPITESSGPRGFTAHGGSVYFRANDGTNGTELWKFTP